MSTMRPGAACNNFRMPPLAVVHGPGFARFLRFTAVGAIGFAIEASIITAFGRWLGWDAIASRAVSFPAAVFATWLLNRTYSYGSANPPAKEGARYLLVQVIGALSNLATFVACVRYFPAVAAWPVACLAAGAVAGLLVNYLLSSTFVFVERRRLHDWK